LKHDADITVQSNIRQFNAEKYVDLLGFRGYKFIFFGCLAVSSTKCHFTVRQQRYASANLVLSDLSL
jgi:hypothetical protein